MNAALQRIAVGVLTAALGKLTAGDGVAERILTDVHLGALAKFLPLLPVGDLLALASGAGTVDNTLDVAEAGAAIVAVAFPPAAIAAEDVRLGLEALQFFLDAAGIGSNPFKLDTRPAARGGPPIAEADWSHGFPQPQPVDNPSGAIGGPGR